MAIDGLTRKEKPVEAHFFRRQSWLPLHSGCALGRSGDGDRPLAGQPRFVPVPVAAPRATPVSLWLANLNAFAERWGRSAKEECLSKLILFGEGPLSRTLTEFSAHFHGERNH